MLIYNYKVSIYLTTVLLLLFHLLSLKKLHLLDVMLYLHGPGCGGGVNPGMGAGHGGGG